MPYKDPLKRKEYGHQRYLMFRETERYRNPDGSWKQTQPQAKKNESGRKSYHKHREKTLQKRKEKIQKKREERTKSCPICDKVSVLCWDHDHASGEFRGYICHSCNLALGHAFDNPTSLRNMALYLEGKLIYE